MLCLSILTGIKLRGSKAPAPKIPSKSARSKGHIYSPPFEVQGPCSLFPGYSLSSSITMFCSTYFFLKIRQESSRKSVQIQVAKGWQNLMVKDDVIPTVSQGFSTQLSWQQLTYTRIYVTYRSKYIAFPGVSCTH